MPKKTKEYDQNIIAALKKLHIPLKTFDGHEIYFDVDKRDETIYEHISDKKHHLFVVDIQRIPLILKDSLSLKPDRNGKRYRNYIGRRGKKNERLKYIRICTEIHKNKKESVVTIYPVKKND